ncbi:MAG: hypothetical protein ACP5RP_03760 [Candidatus Micrarchaeia archaeon]
MDTCYLLSRAFFSFDAMQMAAWRRRHENLADILLKNSLQEAVKERISERV